MHYQSVTGESPTKNAEPGGIRRSRRSVGYTAISNALIDHRDLSAEARLALIYLLSKPDDWEVQIVDLRRVLGRGDKICCRNKAYNILRELKDARYVKPLRIMEAGRFVRFDYVVFDEPFEEPCAEKEDTVQCAEKQDPEKQDGTKERKIQTTDLIPVARKTTPRDELLAVVDAVHADALIEHRQRIRKPLTAYAAKGLAKKLAEWHDPNEAADTVLARGWQGFEARWMQDPRRKGGSAPAAPRIDPLFALAQTISDQAEGGGNVIEH